MDFQFRLLINSRGVKKPILEIESNWALRDEDYCGMLKGQIIIMPICGPKTSMEEPGISNRIISHGFPGLYRAQF